LVQWFLYVYSSVSRGSRVFVFLEMRRCTLIIWPIFGTRLISFTWSFKGIDHRYPICGHPPPTNKETSKGWVCDNFPPQFHFFPGAIHEKYKFKYLKNLTVKVCKIWCNDFYMSILQWVSIRDRYKPISRNTKTLDPLLTEE
jgi:hypothetical protein